MAAARLVLPKPKEELELELIEKVGTIVLYLDSLYVSAFPVYDGPVIIGLSALLSEREMLLRKKSAYGIGCQCPICQSVSCTPVPLTRPFSLQPVVYLQETNSSCLPVDVLRECSRIMELPLYWMTEKQAREEDSYDRRVLTPLPHR